MDSASIRQELYRIPYGYQEKVLEELKDMENNGILEKSECEWASQGRTQKHERAVTKSEIRLINIHDIDTSIQIVSRTCGVVVSRGPTVSQ